MGLVLREIKTGEADKILIIFTEKLGIISASAKNSLRIKSKLLTATALFAYSEFTLFKGKQMYCVNSADTCKTFYNINKTVEGLALAMYLAELTYTVIPHEQESSDQLRLLLNCFYYINSENKSIKLLKAIYQLRTLTNSGVMPNLIMCDKCGKYEGGSFYFDVFKADIICEECAKKRVI